MQPRFSPQRNSRNAFQFLNRGFAKKPGKGRGCGTPIHYPFCVSESIADSIGPTSRPGSLGSQRTSKNRNVASPQNDEDLTQPE